MSLKKEHIQSMIDFCEKSDKWRDVKKEHIKKLKLKLEALECRNLKESLKSQEDEHGEP